MKIKTIRIVALLLTLAFCLMIGCGCASSEEVEEEEEDVAIEAEAEEETEEVEIDLSDVDAEEELAEILDNDLVSWLTEGAYAADDVIFSVGDIDVTAAEALYYLAYEQYNIINYFYYYYYYYYNTEFIISMDDAWDEDMLVGDYVYTVGMGDALGNAVAAAKAAELGVTLDESSLDLIDSFCDAESYGEDRWDDFVSAGLIDEDDFTDKEREAWILEEGESYMLHSMAYYSTTPDGFRNAYTNLCYYQTLEDYLFAEGGEYAPTEADLADYADESGYMWARCILFSTMDCEDDDEKAEVKAQADAALAELAALSGDELEERFTELQEEYDTSGYTAGEVELYATSEVDTYVDGYIDGIAALSIGEVGMTEETDYGYFVLLREERQAEDVESEYIEYAYSQLILQWIDEYAVGCEMSDLNLTDYFAYLSVLQEYVYEVDNITTDE